MIEGNLNTTNLFLGIIAAVSLLHGLVLLAAGILGYRLYSHTVKTVRDIEQRQIAPLVSTLNMLTAKVDGILGDVKDVTARVTRQTERVDSAIHETLHRVDETADRVRSSVAERINQLLGLVHGAKCAMENLFNGRRAA
ncbi:MAG: hypothetical protein EXQ59_06775 [Acidobacteria bacterium]|nr:hypothetical protein [Acidobacteriota bacterium]